jgi:hypothetical protein
MNDKRTYRSFNPATGYPMAKGLFYECLKCGEVVPSQPDDSTCCKCRNIMIDVDYGRMRIQEPERVRLFSTE